MSKELKILYIDIETTPSLGWVWGKYDQNVIEFEKEWYILCFTAKWAGSNKLITSALPDFQTYAKNTSDDKELMRKLWDLLNEADIVIAHNGDSFDVKKINSRFIINGLLPPSPYRTIDTRKIAKKHFGFNSNKLDDIGNILGIGRKLSTGGFKLWTDCMNGDLNAWKKMKAYNKQDVLLLEQVYLKLRPWIKNHPNIGINVAKEACHSCGSLNTQKRGYAYTRATKYQRIHCSACGGWSQIRLSKEEVAKNGKV